VIFGVEELMEELHAKYHPHQCKGEGVEPKNGKKIYQISKYKCVALVRPLHDSYKIFTDCGELHAGSHVKIREDSLTGFWNYGGSISADPVTPKFSVPPSGKTASYPQTFKRCKNVLEVLYHHATFG